ncbi:MAG: two-component system response regulator CreB [Proteobacteria bacterium]|nr:MAG: two-component system response regulator CreB [Pseudomonadota bacterium]PIE64850.1 MAG: two-component system response regulator CreB [Desulfobacterales bacterium]
MQSRVVVVEDEPAIAETIQYALETDGFTTVWLQEGMPLLSLLAREQVDLVILDIGLPDINGIDLCKKVRRDSSVPVIFLTARSDEIDRVVGLEIGGDDYVVKPFSPRELAARVKAVLRRIDSNDRKQGVRAGKKWFEVDRERRVICYCGTGLDLSRYEYNLLLVFIENPGRVFSRDQLMEQAWDEPDASMDRTIDAHIKNIRSKLKKIKPDRDPILTHRGVGYSLREG